MGKYQDDLNQRKRDAEIDAQLYGEEADNKIASLKEALALLSNTKDGQTKLEGVISAAITAALGSEGAITTAISNAITAALGENGAITTAISGAITAAIGAGGSIETWGDGRYEAKSGG